MIKPPPEPQIRELIAAAKEASKLAYCPYSNWAVGAAVLTFDGQIYSGCNIENCGFTQTIHAEQTAMANAISAGALRRAADVGLSQLEFIKAIAVSQVSGSDPWPCCNCRQSLNEFGLDMYIVGDDNKGGVIHKQLRDLIPHAFDMEGVLATAHGPEWRKKSVVTIEVDGSRPLIGENRKWIKLVDAARNASRMAYCPYSNYAVGAAILTFDGEIYTGCNVENCGYTQTIHAEQTALAKAVSAGALRRALDAGLKQTDFIEAIAISSPKSAEPWPSCNGRQCLSEFGLKMNVIGQDKNGAVVGKKLEDLIPFAFPMEVVLASAHQGDS